MPVTGTGTHGHGELSAPPPSEQAASFGLTVERRKRLEADRSKGL